MTLTVSTTLSPVVLPARVSVNRRMIEVLSAVNVKWKCWKVTNAGFVVLAAGGLTVWSSRLEFPMA